MIGILPIKQILISSLFLILLFTCAGENASSLRTGFLHDGIYTNKFLNLCIEPAIYASLYSFRKDSNKLEAFTSKKVIPNSDPLIPLVCLKDLIEMRISLANSDIFGDFKDDRSIDYFKSTVSTLYDSTGEACKVNVIESKQIEIEGKQFLSNYYYLEKGDMHVYEKQLFTHVEDRYLLFHLSDVEELDAAQIKELFKAIKFDCI